MKLRQRRRNESEGVTTTMEIYPALPGERVPVCVDWDVWEMVLEEQTHPTNRVNARTALPSLFTLFWLDFQRPRILSLKGEAVKTTTTAATTTTTLQSVSEKIHPQNKISSFSLFSKRTSWFLFSKMIFLHEGLQQNPKLFPNNIINSQVHWIPVHFLSLQALRRWMPQENPSQWEAASSSRWTGRTMASPTLAVWSTCLLPTPTWQLKSWRSTVSAIIHTLCKAGLGVRLALRRNTRIEITFMSPGLALHLLRISVGLVCR